MIRIRKNRDENIFDTYTKRVVQELLENGEISAQEAAFMMGYLEDYY